MKRLLVTAAVIVGLGLTAHGYVLSGYRWEIKEIPYYVNPVNQDISQAAALAAVQWAADAWSIQTDADIRLVYAGLSNATQPSCNGKSEVMFRNVVSPVGNVGGAWRCRSGTTLTETDIVFYDGGYTFYSAAIGGCQKAAKGHYIEGIGIHEFGHLFGLQHTDVTGATMKAGAVRCSKEKMSLHADDIAGIEYLYPPSGTPDPVPDPEPDPDEDTTPPSGITLSIVRFALRTDGDWGVELDWEGISTQYVWLYKNGVLWKSGMTATGDTGKLLSLGSTSPGPYTFMVCDAGTTTCSPSVTGSAQ